MYTLVIKTVLNKASKMTITIFAYFNVMTSSGKMVKTEIILHSQWTLGRSLTLVISKTSFPTNPNHKKTKATESCCLKESLFHLQKKKNETFQFRSLHKPYQINFNPIFHLI